MQHPMCFRDLPYNKIKEIKIDIDSPNHSDPGQMLCIWENVSIVDLLSPVSGIKSLVITFSGNWGTKTKPQKSFPDYRRLLDTRYDIDLTLMQLCRIRYVLKPSTHFRFEGEGGGVCPIVKGLEADMMSRQPFGGPYAKDQLDQTKEDEQIQLMIDNTCLVLERILEEAFGITANLLRRERFASWFTEAGVCVDESSPDYVKKYQAMAKKMLSWEAYDSKGQRRQTSSE